MRLLITGGSGLLGSKTASISVRKGYETYTGYNDHEATNGTPVKLDICDKREVDKAFEKAKPDAVIHAAALTNVDKCEEDNELARKVNIGGTKNITEAAEQIKAFLVYVSTDYVFSGEEGSYKETDEPNPVNNYGLTKLEGEKIVTSSNLEWCIARSSVIYGSTPAAGKDNFVLWALNKLKNEEPLRIVTDQRVSPTLNTSLAEMTLEILERRLTGVYHLAGATPLNRYDFARLIAGTFQLDEGLIASARSSDMKWLAKRPRDSSLNVEKASKTLDNKPLKIREALNMLKEEMIVI
jgi:dTDP-4-dehydrorhamnose reductase